MNHFAYYICYATQTRYEMTTETATVRRKKSEELTKDQRKALRQYRTKFDTSVACATSIGIDRNVLERVLLAGSGAPETISKIREAINQTATA